MNVDDKKRKDSPILNRDSVRNDSNRLAIRSVIDDGVEALNVMLIGVMVGIALVIPFLYNPR